MARPTKADIERLLLGGVSIAWKDAAGKSAQLSLLDPRERRLFAFLLGSKVREPTGLSQQFIDGLATAYGGADDPAASQVVKASPGAIAGPWRLDSIETEGFGGLNIWGGPLFHFQFDQESLLVEGPNGSGKSSLVGAIIWALAGERPRDQSDADAHEPRAVFGMDEKHVGDWPPIACYPPSALQLSTPTRVRVQLGFKDPAGTSAKVERILDAGKITTSIDPLFDVPSVLIDAGLLMPARLAQLRLDDGGGRLTDAVQKLTGLDDLIAIGALTEGLCHKSREYLSFKKKELTAARKDFENAFKTARESLSPVQVSVPDFPAIQTEDPKSDMAVFVKMLGDRAAELTKVIANDLAGGLNLASSVVQQQVISAIGGAQEDLKMGLEGLTSWKSLQSTTQTLNEEALTRIAAAITTAQTGAAEAIRFLEKSSKDSRFQLKAMAANWHAKHSAGSIESCPLCEQDIKLLPSLMQELEELRSSGDAAARTFDDNMNAILLALETSLPASIKKFGVEVLTLEPRKNLIAELRANFVSKERYAKILQRFSTLVDSALAGAPPEELVSATAVADDVLKRVNERIAVIQRLVNLAAWHRANADAWKVWWTGLVDAEQPKELGQAIENSSASSGGVAAERLTAHLLRLMDALAKAEPYRKASLAMSIAWSAGKIIADIERELNRRDAIAARLAGLKSLGPLAESVTREAIDGLSARIATLLKRIHLSGQLHFHNARLQRKEGLIVRGGFGPDLRIDATLVANTSWLRAVLWAFLFSLREEAVEQSGIDQFPIYLFDDPQSTFDSEHRHRWAQYIAGLQGGSSKAQVVLTTYDEIFLDLIKVDGVTGRQAMIAAASAELGYVGILEGGSLDRKWTMANAQKTSVAGREYMSAVRVYVEGLLRLMLRGEDASVSTFVMGDSRQKIHDLHSAGIAPWNHHEFKKLVGLLEKSLSPIKYMEIAHHASGVHLGMTEAEDVEEHWRKRLRPALERAFRVAREHHLLHGGLKALHAGPATVTLPIGFPEKVRSIPLKVLGRASALSNGRVADGRLELQEFSASAHKDVTLAQHFAYRLVAQTLEPVARVGDMVLVADAGEPPAKSLVVALREDRILARRFELAENNSDVAVLTAQSINPRRIAQPVIAHKGTLTLHKIIGVLYEESAWGAPQATEMEVTQCAGDAILVGIASSALGLVEVVGHSAEPHALDGQYIILRKEISAEEALKTLDGRPIVAEDTDGDLYFKRLRIPGGEQIVLESMDSGGDYGPVVLSLPGGGKKCLKRVWPVAGVLFHLPN